MNLEKKKQIQQKIQQKIQQQIQNQRQKQNVLQQEILEVVGKDYPGEEKERDRMIETRIEKFLINLEEKKNTLKIVKLKFDPELIDILWYSGDNVDDIYLDRLRKLLLEIVNLEDLTLSGFNYVWNDGETYDNFVIHILENKKSIKKLDISRSIFDYQLTI